MIFQSLQDNALELNISQLLSNDVDNNSPDEVIAFVGVADVVNGQLDFNDTTGDLIFTPETGFFGEASFSYSIRDEIGALGSTTVLINVIEVITIIGTDENNYQNDLLTNIRFNGLAGKDGFVLLGGNNYFDGGEDYDTLFLSGEPEDYTFVTDKGDLLVTRTSDNVSVVLQNVEGIWFGDVRIHLSVNNLIDNSNGGTETLDSDGDGVADNADAFPYDASETLDNDGDGVGDNADAFPFDENETLDTDGDGVGDNSDFYPNDPTRSEESDNSTVDRILLSSTSLTNY